MTSRSGRLARVCRGAVALTGLAASVYFLLIPALISVHDLRDPALATGQVPRLGWRLFRTLTPRYEAWARSRVASGRARQLGTDNIAGTEWPVFGSVFYLWAVESLQEAWEKDHGLARTAPRFLAQGAVDASVALVLDEGHAAWVKQHWGPSYLEHGNLFYRALRLAAMAAHLRLTGEPRYQEPLARESARLAGEIEASPHGLLEDYPGQCYPADVLVAWAILHRVATVLGEDDGPRLRRALRGFAGQHADGHGLPPYACEIGTGTPLGEARGCSNSYLLLVAAELWPEQARAWYGRHERFFWQWRHGVAGFREFPADRASGNWYLDVDAGPVLAGHGVAATAFGLGAALANGRRDQAAPLLAELFAVAWPLPDGTLLLPRLLSNATDAPYLGEAAVLYIVSRQPSAPTARAVVAGDGRIPGLVYLTLGGELVLGALLTASAIRLLRRRRVAAPRRS